MGSEIKEATHLPGASDSLIKAQSSAGYRYNWLSSINEISSSDWSKCFSSHYFARSYAYQQAVEASAPSGVEFEYLVVYEEDSLQAILGCFRYRIPLSTTATGSARKVMGAIESLLPNLFSINAFFVGQLTAVCDHLYGLELIAKGSRSALLTGCETPIRERAKALGSSVIIHKEIPEHDLEMVRTAIGDSYVVAPSLPAMQLSLKSNEPYSTQLRKKYRVHYKRRQKLAEQHGLTWAVHRGPLTPSLMEEMEKLYFQVLERSATQFERLSGKFFSALLEHCAGASVVLCKDAEKLVGFMINVEGEENFHGLYLGYDTAYRDAAVYFNLIYRSLDVAIEQGFQSIHLGQTSYEIKSALGAQRENLSLALRASNRLLQWFIKSFSRHLFPEVTVPVRRAFPVEPVPAASKKKTSTK